jgi:hypothetical protein
MLQLNILVTNLLALALFCFEIKVLDFPNVISEGHNFIICRRLSDSFPEKKVQIYTAVLVYEGNFSFSFLMSLWTVCFTVFEIQFSLINLKYHHLKLHLFD